MSSVGAQAVSGPRQDGALLAKPSARFIERAMPVLLGALALVALLAAVIVGGAQMKVLAPLAALLAVVGLGGRSLMRSSRSFAAIVFLSASSLAAYTLVFWLDGGAGVRERSDGGLAFWCVFLSAWLLAWLAVDQLAALQVRWGWLRTLLSVLVPVLFGLWLLVIWECVTRGLDVPTVLLPPPSMIAERFVTSTSILWADFQQTFIKAVLIGWSIGCLSGFAVAVLVDRSPFLKRGLLPIGNLVAALPIVGLAPIMVMWFGFDWPSKAAVVIVMTFFPMLVSTVAGLSASDAMQRDLMNTYAADYRQTLLKLRLPQAMPFIFNALKITSTLALIGAIVAEFFGTPIVGMGFRISTEVGRMNVDMVWAEIAVAALAGSTFYGVLALIERVVTFWHPSIRNRGAFR